MNNAGFLFCLCPDGRLLRSRVEELLAAHAPEGAGAWERHIYWGDDELPPVFWEYLGRPDMLGEKRALVVRRAEALPAATWKRLSAAVASPGPHRLPVFCLESPWEKGRPKLPAHVAKLKCLAFAETQGWVERLAGLEERSLRVFVRKEAAARGLRFESGADELLCAGLIPDAGAVTVELDKLSLAAPDGVLTANIVSQAAQMPQFNIFQFLRLVQGGKTREAWAELLRARQESETLLFPLLALLLREARLLWRLAHKETPNMHPNEAANKRRLATRLGVAGITRLFHLLFQADLSVKSGERRPEQALDALTAEIGLLAAGQPREERHF